MHATLASKCSPYEHIWVEFHIRNQTSGTVTHSSQAQPHWWQTSAVLRVWFHLGWLHPVRLLQRMHSVTAGCSACTGFFHLSWLLARTLLNSVSWNQKTGQCPRSLGSPLGRSASQTAGQTGLCRNLMCRVRTEWEGLLLSSVNLLYNLGQSNFCLYTCKLDQMMRSFSRTILRC